MKTPLMEFVYPTERDPSWYSVWETMVGQFDSSMYASLENPSLVLTGGGTVSLSGNELTWTEDFEILALQRGGRITIPAGSITDFPDGSIAYVEVTRPVSGNSIGTLESAYYLAGTADANKVALIVRRGTELVFRNQVTSLVGLASVKDYRGTNKFTTDPVTASGGTLDGSLAVGVDVATVPKTRFTALADTTDIDIELFADSGRTDKLKEFLAIDAYTAAYNDRSGWVIDDLVDGTLYYTITNDGANDSAVDIEMVIIGNGV